MCIHYRTRLTNKRLLFPGDNVFTHFKCGVCFECMEERSKEMSYRGLKQAEDTFSKGGYTLFDTLTYSEEYVPRINETLDLNLENNFYCFNSKHFTNFLKLVRIRLQRLYNETKSISILYTGEYGTDQGCTHRPHIHMILFYTGKLNPCELSKLISDCWKYGRTDGIVYKGKNYLLNKRVFNNKNAYSINQLRYVTKYLEKESQYYKTIKERENIILKSLNVFNDELNNELNYQNKLEIRKKLNCIRQFSRISSNFGISALKEIDKDELLKGNTLLKLPNHKKVVEFINIPRYYIRKLFQKPYYYNIKNDVLMGWEWTEEGELYKLAKQKANNIYNFNRYTKLYETSYKKKADKHIIRKLADYRNNCGIISNMPSNYLINYNTPKDKKLRGEMLLEDKDGNEYKFKNLIYYYNDDIELSINQLENDNTELGKLRHRNYIDLCKRRNKAKYLGLI